MIGACIFSSIFITVGFTALIYNYVFTDDWGLFFLIWGGGFAWGGLSLAYESTIGGLARQKQWFLYNHQTIDWYKKQYPQYVKSTNVLQCCFCEGDMIKRYYIKNRTYKISNYCAKCSEVLFYSDEN